MKNTFSSLCIGLFAGQIITAPTGVLKFGYDLKKFTLASSIAQIYPYAFREPLFKEFDTNGSGFVDVSEYRNGLKNISEYKITLPGEDIVIEEFLAAPKISRADAHYSLGWKERFFAVAANFDGDEKSITFKEFQIQDQFFDQNYAGLTVDQITLCMMFIFQ